MTAVWWHPRARRELFEACAFYDAESEGLGEIFLSAIEQGIDVLKLQPQAGAKVLRETRRFVVARFPYSIVYRIGKVPDREQPRLFILAVAHHKRRPRYWAQRA